MRRFAPILIIVAAPILFLLHGPTRERIIQALRGGPPAPLISVMTRSISMDNLAGVATASLLIMNLSEQALEKVTIRCTAIDASGKSMVAERIDVTANGPLRAGGRRSIDAKFEVGQGGVVKEASCETIRAE